MNGLTIVCLLACWHAVVLISGETILQQSVDQTNLNETVKMVKGEEVDAFSSKVIHA